MRQRLIVFACLAAMLALAACDTENHQVIELLKVSSELSWLNVTAYADDFALTGGATVEPGLRPGVFNYTVYLAKDANRFTIDAGIGAVGTIVATSVEDQITGTDFDYLDDQPKIITLTVEREYMKLGNYRLTVVRADIVPVAENIKITADPEIAAFFIGSGVLPTIKVTADLPAAGGALTYQWYMNTVDLSIGGFQISGETGDTYTMKSGETQTVRTVYYYVEITNTINGKTGITFSPPCAVTFINKGELAEKSLSMTDIPAGSVQQDQWGSGYNNQFWGAWSTPGFKMGTYLVTWELWKTVFDYASAGNYDFSRKGNQGGAGAYENQNDPNDTNTVSRPIGNVLNPVTNISWRDAVVWCNAFSEMDGKEPVYRDLSGEPLRDSRDSIDMLVDFDATAGYNGYRLPTAEEWIYAARGANPSGSHWNYYLPGTNSYDVNEIGKYLWALSPEIQAGGVRQTGEVGKLLPNNAGLYDISGMVFQWICWPDRQKIENLTYAAGSSFLTFSFTESSLRDDYYSIRTTTPNSSSPDSQGKEYAGFRLARNGEE